MDNIFLSITIPTVNRSNELKENLSELLPQIVGRNDVEICVCDNACEDDTGDMVKLLFSQFDCNCIYKRYEERVSGRENFKRAVELTSGKFVLLMGDDDILSPFFVTIMTEFLKCQAEDFNFVHFNRMYGPPDFSDCRLFDFKRFSNVRKFKVQDFIANYLASPTFMSSIVFRRSCWNAGLKFEKEYYYGYEWLSTILFGGIYGECAYMYFPLVLARNSFRPWRGRWPLYGIIGLTHLFRDLSSYNGCIIEKWNKVIHDGATFYNTIPSMAYEKRIYKEKRKELQDCLINKKERLAVFLILDIWPTWLTIKFHAPIVKVYFFIKHKVLKRPRYRHLV